MVESEVIARLAERASPIEGGVEGRLAARDRTEVVAPAVRMSIEIAGISFPA
jgi:hypothetical protein